MKTIVEEIKCAINDIAVATNSIMLAVSIVIGLMALFLLISGVIVNSVTYGLSLGEVEFSFNNTVYSGIGFLAVFVFFEILPDPDDDESGKRKKSKAS